MLDTRSRSVAYCQKPTGGQGSGVASARPRGPATSSERRGRPDGALERVEPPTGQVAYELLVLLDRHDPVRDLAPRGAASVPGIGAAGVGVVSRVAELVEVVVSYPAGGD
jgi:hypothetical protein